MIDVEAYRALAAAVLRSAVHDAWRGNADAIRFLSGPSAALWLAWLRLTPEDIHRWNPKEATT